MGYKLKGNIIKERLDNTKFDIRDWTQEMKFLFQEEMFKLGFRWWGDDSSRVIHLDHCYYFLSGGLITFTELGKHKYFESKEYLELTWKDLFKEVSDTDLVEEFLDKVGLSSDLHIHHSVSPQNVTTGEVKDSLGSYISPEPEPFKFNFQTDAVTEWTDKHYDNYYTLTEEDIEEGKIRIDAYFVNRMWKLNSIDDTGCAFHCLKTYTRMANGKNSMERELNALNGQLKRWAKLMNVKLK